MRHEFGSNEVKEISSGAPSEVQSTIGVAGLHGRLVDVNVTLDIEHTWTRDLEISLEGPGGQRVLLVKQEGGSGNNFDGTVFDDAATTPVAGAAAPFRGTFRPEESLSAFNDVEPNGEWTLHVADLATADGGSLNSWSLSIETGSFVFENRTPVAIDPGPPTTVQSEIDVTGLGGLVVKDIKVTIDINHTWDKDLAVTLIARTGIR